MSSTLTPRQEEVFRLAGDGLSASRIAAELEMSRRTVEAHIAQIKQRLDVPSKQALVVAARDYFGLAESSSERFGGDGS